MRYFTHLLYAVIVTLAFNLVAHAEEGFLWVNVSNPQGLPIPGVQLSVAGPGSASPPTANNGLTRIKLASGTKVGQEVKLVIVHALPNLVLISPWDHNITIPCFDDNDDDCVAKVVLAERGSRLLLENGDAAKAMLSLVMSKLNLTARGNSEITNEEWKQAVLAEVANHFGVTPAEVDRAIREWKPKPEDKRAEGLRKLYEGKKEEARAAFSESKARRKVDLAEDTFLEGWAYESLARYRDAIASYLEALTYHPDDSRIMFRLGITYDIVGESESAEKSLRRALEINEKNLGPDSLEVAGCAMSLASVYYNRGDHKQGVPLMERAVAIRQQLKGREYPLITHDLANVAIGYIMLRKIQEAEALIQRALRIAESRGVRASVELAYVLNALGPIYYQKGDIQKTEQVFQHSLEVLRNYIEKSTDKEQARREGAYNYAQAAGFLGYIYKQQGRFAKAEPFLKAALEYEELEGPLLPSDVERLDMLADLYVLRGNFSAAGQLVARSLDIMAPAVGKENAKVVTRIKLLAMIYETQKKFAEAEQLRAHVIQIAEKGGPEGLVKELLEQAEYYGRRGRYAEAEDYFNRAAVLAEKIAIEHPGAVVYATLSLLKYYEKRNMLVEVEQLYKIMGGLSDSIYRDDPAGAAVAPALMARFYQKQKRYAEAESCHLRAEAIIEKALGGNHPAMIRHLHYRAELYEEQGRFAEAEQLYKRAAQIASEADYKSKISTLYTLAEFYMSRNRYDNAEQIYKQVQSVLDNAKEADEQDKLALRLYVAELYKAAKRYAEAETIYQGVLLATVKENGPSHPKVAMLYEALAELGAKQGKNSEAEDKYKRALTILEQEVGLEDLSVAKCLEGYAALLRTMKRYSEATAREERAKKIKDKPTLLREDEN